MIFLLCWVLFAVLLAGPAWEGSTETQTADVGHKNCRLPLAVLPICSVLLPRPSLHGWETRLVLSDAELPKDLLLYLGRALIQRAALGRDGQGSQLFLSSCPSKPYIYMAQFCPLTSLFFSVLISYLLQVLLVSLENNFLLRQDSDLGKYIF